MTRSAPTVSKVAKALPVIAKAQGKSLRERKFKSGGAPQRVASAPRPTAVKKPVLIALGRESTVDDAIALVVSACRAHWQTNAPAATQGDIEGVHQVRVALRRFRSALSAFKKHIPATQRAALNAEAKWLGAQLGPARDLDVFIGTLAAPVAEHVSDNAALAQVMRAARGAQGKAHNTATEVLQSRRARRLAARIDAWVSGRGWRTAHDGKQKKSDVSAADFARRFVNRRLRNIRSDYDAIERLSVEQRHDLRIDVKKLRYGLEFFQALLPAKRTLRLSSLLKELQDTLGHLNDIAVADRTIDALVNDAASGLERRRIAAGGNAIGAWHKKAAGDAAPDTVKLWHKLKKVRAF
jgi:triphosphatase